MADWFLHSLPVLGFPKQFTNYRRHFFIKDLKIAQGFLRAVEMINQAPFAQDGPLRASLMVARYADAYQLTYPEMGHWEFSSPGVYPDWDFADRWKFPSSLLDILIVQRRFPEWYVACLREQFLPAYYKSAHGPSRVHLLPIVEIPITLLRHPPFRSVLDDIGGLYT